MRTVVALLACALSSCSDAKPADISSARASVVEPAAPPSGSLSDKAPERADDQPAPIISLADLTLSQEGRPIARLHADGRSEGTEPDSSGKPAVFVPGPTLRADGTVTLTKGGFSARVERGGDVYIVAPTGTEPREQLFARIVGHELQDAKPNSWIARVEGDTIRFNGNGFPNKIEGTVDDQRRRTALVMVAVFFIDLELASR
jgi:hypothetical protein